MKKQLLLSTSLLLGAAPVYAGPGVFIGITYNFGGSVGIGLKILSTNVERRAAVAAGVSYFPSTHKFGIDAGAGYVFKNGAATLGWDFLNKAPQVGLGFVRTKDRDEENRNLFLFQQQQAAEAAAALPPPPLGSDT